jgi:hypothetical protein
MPDKPTPQHTVLITCCEPGCGAKRWVKPQDAWQVKRCRTCQENKKNGGAMARLEKVKKMAVAKKEAKDTAKRVIKKLYVQHYHWSSPIKPSGVKLRRMWP